MILFKCFVSVTETSKFMSQKSTVRFVIFRLLILPGCAQSQLKYPNDPGVFSIVIPKRPLRLSVSSSASPMTHRANARACQRSLNVSQSIVYRYALTRSPIDNTVTRRMATPRNMHRHTGNKPLNRHRVVGRFEPSCLIHRL